MWASSPAPDPPGKGIGATGNWLALDRTTPPLPLGSPAQRDRQDPLYCFWPGGRRLHQQERQISSPFSAAQLTGHTLLMVGLIAVVCGDIGYVRHHLFLFESPTPTAGVDGSLWAGTLFVGAILGPVHHIFSSDRFAYTPAIGLWSYWTTAWIRGAGFQQSRSRWPSARASGRGIQNQRHPDQASQCRFLPDTRSSPPSAGRSLACGLPLCPALIIPRVTVGRNASSPFSAYVSMGIAGTPLA